MKTIDQVEALICCGWIGNVDAKQSNNDLILYIKDKVTAKEIYHYVQHILPTLIHKEKLKDINIIFKKRT